MTVLLVVVPDVVDVDVLELVVGSVVDGVMSVVDSAEMTCSVQ